jgi:hypothetical protein
VLHDTKKERHQKKRALSDDENRFAVAAVNHRAAEGGKQHSRQTETQAFQSQIEGRVGELKDQPALRRGLNQRAGVAEQQAEPVDEIIAVAKSAEGVREEHAEIELEIAITEA